MEKTCRQCHLKKPLGEFYAHPRMADGHLNKCKVCVRTRVGIHREVHLDTIREYDRTRKRRKTKKPYSKKQKNAAQKVGRAIAYGVMKRKPCVICGSSKTEGHHQDYDKPYDVIWLCPEHHRRLHHKKFTILPRIIAEQAHP